MKSLFWLKVIFLYQNVSRGTKQESDLFGFKQTLLYWFHS